MFLLQGLPGIGPERARRLLTHFGSVEKVVTADAKSLAEIDGIGNSRPSVFGGLLHDTNNSSALLLL